MKKKKELQKLINKLVEVSFKDGRLLENQVVKSIKILKSVSKTEAIFALSEYLKALKRKQREHTLLIETTIPLSTSQIAKVKKIVEKKVKVTKIVTQINPEILGGFKIRVGDEIVDETILGRIKQIKEAIVSS